MKRTILTASKFHLATNRNNWDGSSKILSICFLLLLSQGSLSEIRGTFIHRFIQICKIVNGSPLFTSIKCFKMGNNCWCIFHLLMERAWLIPCQFFVRVFAHVIKYQDLFKMSVVCQTECLSRHSEM